MPRWLGLLLFFVAYFVALGGVVRWMLENAL